MFFPLAQALFDNLAKGFPEFKISQICGRLGFSLQLKEKQITVEGEANGTRIWFEDYFH